MLSTEELKKYIYNEIQGVLGEVSCSNLFFDEGTNDSIEGTYIFNKNNVEVKTYFIVTYDNDMLPSHTFLK